MTPTTCQQLALAAVERASGKPVILDADPKLPNEALIRIATEAAPAHVLKYRAASEPELPYLVCFQCAMALRAVLAPRDERFNVTSSPSTYAAVRQLVDEKNPDRLGFPVPGDMRVQGWVWPRQTAACAAGAEALAEADAAHAAANPAGV
jgi:hypothetical protein